MAKYCLTYDAKDSKSQDPEELKIAVTRILLASGAFDLKSPTASTIIFEDESSKSTIQQWNALFLKFKGEIYYYLCKIAKTKENDYFDSNEGDPNLNDDFQELLEYLE